MSDDSGRWRAAMRCVVALLLVILGYAHGYSTGVTGQDHFAKPLRYDLTGDQPTKIRNGGGGGGGRGAAAWGNQKNAAFTGVSDGDGEADTL